MNRTHIWTATTPQGGVTAYRTYEAAAADLTAQGFAKKSPPGETFECWQKETLLCGTWTRYLGITPLVG